MSSISKFEDLEIWQKARVLCANIYKETSSTKFSKDFELIRQIKRASGSIMDNIAERFERDGNREFIQFLSIAKGSAGEVRSQLYRALDQEYISQKSFNDMYELSNDISRMISSFIGYLNKTEVKGRKFQIQTQNK